MTNPTAHWSPSEIDDDGDRASYPPPAFRDGERDPSVIAAYARAEMDRLASDNPDLATAWSDVERAALALVRSSIGASGLLDLDAIEARWRNATKGPWKLTQVRGFGATNIIVSEHPEASWYCVVAIVHNAGGSDAMNAMAAARTDVPALVARVRELESALTATKAESRTALDALHKRCDAAEAEVGRLRAQIAAAHGVTTPPTDDELSDEAATWIVTAPHSAGYAVRVLNAEDARRYRDNARGVHVWHLWDERTGCPAPRITATPDRDLCPTCGALDLDHSPEECARRWAEAHPYAAGAMHGGIAHKSEVAK